jgi:hypothetical protein
VLVEFPVECGDEQGYVGVVFLHPSDAGGGGHEGNQTDLTGSRILELGDGRGGLYTGTMSSVNNNKGVFVISLDYELLWGVWDVKDVEKYGNNIIGVKAVIPRLLELFSRHDLKVTFATVGILFAKNKNELLPYLP